MSSDDEFTRAIRRRLESLSASILADATGGKGVVSPGLVRFSGAGTVAGRAVTADCEEGSLQPVFAALDQAAPGAFLCLTAPGAFAYMGDLLATDIMSRGLVGAVVDGLIRDREAISNMSASFYARGVTPFALRGQTPGAFMVPISIGGVIVNAGDWIIGDDDGIIAVPAAEIEMVLEKAEENARIEEKIMARIAAGAKVRDAVRIELAEAAKAKRS